jgi:hypothetical protein
MTEPVGTGFPPPPLTEIPTGSETALAIAPDIDGVTVTAGVNGAVLDALTLAEFEALL